ncbi:50S ribosomal protein L30 [Halarchaeum nitratireducens]|uniref:Large ribosomal subunit protein uL30 n=1 Tax=Halarchaeum nitratireducens TaxID=489913 RepID=A0A830G7A1_9EURY|nr:MULTISPECIES: 50S ribosomal protein L30 [Halarchaeum]MBP2251333.1 large subunit ribosomal protein L30 [Halarchaeum solikamskense]GGN07940.1 50S ribosomal protein L30 [Halarchaeum nitratireducens]
MQAVVQLRGEVDMRSSVEDTLSMLNLHRVNHATLVPETDAYDGMIAKVNDYVAYGEPSLETVKALIAKRAEPLEGDADVDDEWVAENTDYDDVDDLARALYNENTTLREAGLSPVVRLHPPRGGHQGIKQPQSEGGQLGKQSTEEVDELLERMR